MKRISSICLALSLGAVLAVPCTWCSARAQGAPTTDENGKPLLSPPADARVSLGSAAVEIHYNTPSIRGRKIMGGLVPYGQVWRTGANPATSLKISAPIIFGTKKVPAGAYTLYTLPSAGTWMLIVNKQTGQWGTEYSRSQDLVRVEMKKSQLPKPQETMSISFEKTSGSQSELHIRWETTDVWVPISAH